MLITIHVDMIHPANTLNPRNYMFVGEFEQNGNMVQLFKRGRSNTKFWARWR